MAENQTTLDKDKWGTKVLSAAIRGEYETVLQHIGFSELCNVEDRESVYTEAVHLAARGGHTATIEAFLGTGLNVDCASKVDKGWTPLITAASGGHNSTVQAVFLFHFLPGATKKVEFGTREWPGANIHKQAGYREFELGAKIFRPFLRPYVCSYLETPPPKKTPYITTS